MTNDITTTGKKHSHSVLYLGSVINILFRTYSINENGATAYLTLPKSNNTYPSVSHSYFTILKIKGLQFAEFLTSKSLHAIPSGEREREGVKKGLTSNELR